MYQYPEHLTPSELERHAYIAGDSLTAMLAGELEDCPDESTIADLEEDARKEGYTKGYDEGVNDTDPDGALDDLAKVQDKLAAMGKLLSEVRQTLEAKGALDRKALATRVRTVQGAYGVY